MTFKTPIFLALIPAVFLLAWAGRRWKRPAVFRFPSFVLLSHVPVSWRERMRSVTRWVRYGVLVLFVIALAGPRKVSTQTVHKTEGIDIVLTIDVSGSMAAEDFRLNGRRVNRLAVVKNVVKEFIAQRPNDRLGLVAFSGRAYTVCPMTTDSSWLLKNLERLDLHMIEPDGTAIGSAIAASLSRLKKSKASSRVIILLTDGVNNAGTITPREAAEAAKALGVKIYTIGVGTKGFAPFPVQDMFGRTVYQKVAIELDEKILKSIANITDGRYFRATDTDSLRKIYKEIDQLEKTPIEEYGYMEYTELFPWVLGAALLLLLGEVVLSRTIVQTVP